MDTLKPYLEDVLYQQLAHALKCSGSLARHSVDVKVLATPDDILGAYDFPLQADMHMPVFRAKIDSANLLAQIPPGPLRPAQLSLQQVSYMGTDWLGVRLVQGTHEQCMQFALCITALLNISSKHSRSVLVEVRSDGELDMPGFACAPLLGMDKRSPSVETLIRRAEEISELATIIMNEITYPPKKVVSLLDKWCKMCHKQLVEPESNEREKKKSFLLNAVFGNLEEQLSSLTSSEKGKSLKGHSPRSPTRHKKPLESGASASSGSSGEFSIRVHQEQRTSSGRSGGKTKRSDGSYDGSGMPHAHSSPRLEPKQIIRVEQPRPESPGGKGGRPHSPRESPRERSGRKIRRSKTSLEGTGCPHLLMPTLAESTDSHGGPMSEDDSNVAEGRPKMVRRLSNASVASSRSY
jgi:hypothetical protein